MRWLKIVIASLLVGCIGLAAFAAFIAATYDDDDYRYALIYAVNRMTGGTLFINGPFSVELSMTPSITASKIRFDAADGTGEAYIEELALTFKLLPLLERTLWIKRMSVSHAHIELPMGLGDDEEAAERLWVPVIEQAALNEITVDYRKADASVALFLQQLRIEPELDRGLLLIRGAGRVQEHSYTLEGRAGNLGELVRSDQAYPLDLTVRFKNTRLGVAGTVGVSGGAGLNLQLTAETADLAEVLHVLQYPAPELGEFRATARLTGDRHAPSLSDLKMDLSRKNALTLRAEGSVKDLLTGVGTAVHLSGSIDDQSILDWILPDNLPPVSHLNLSGDLNRPGSLWMLERVQLQMTEGGALSMALNGRTGLVSDFSEPQPFRNMDLKLRLESTTTETARPLIPKFFPEIGPVRFTGRLVAPSAADLALQDMKVDIGTDRVSLKLDGRIGKMPVAPDIPNSDLAFDIAVQAENNQVLARMLGYSLPDIGPVEMTAHWQGSRLESSFDRIRLATGHPKRLMIEMEGSIQLGDVATSKPVKRANGTVRIAAAKSALLGPLLGIRLPEVGPVDGRARIHSAGLALSLQDIRLSTTRPRPIRLALNGQVSRIQLDKPIAGIALSGQLDADTSTALVAALGGPPTPDIGPAKVAFSLTGSEDALALRDVNLTAGRSQGLTLSVDGGIGRISPAATPALRHVDFQLSAKAASTQVLAALVKQPLPGDDPVSLSTHIKDKRGTLVFEKLSILIGPEAKPALRATGFIDDRSTAKHTVFNVALKSSTAQLLGYLFNKAYPDLGSIQANVLVGDQGGRFAVQTLSLSGGKPGWFQFKADQLTAAPERVFQTTLSMKNLGVVNALSGSDLPLLGPVELSGRLTAGRDQERFRGDIQLGKTVMTSDLVTSQTGHRRAVSGRVWMPVLYRGDFTTRKRGRAEHGPTAPPKYLFGRQPLPFDRLKRVDLALVVEAGAVQGFSKRLGPIKLDVTVNNGQLRGRPMQRSDADVLGLTTQIRTGPMPYVAVRVNGAHTDLRPVLYQNGGTPQDGELYLSANLRSSGRSVHELVSAMSGDLGIVMENGEIDSANLNLISLNIMRWLFTLTTHQREKVNCAVARFNVRKGIAVSNILYLDTPTLSASGKATVDFSSETIDMIIHTEPKKGLLPAGLPLQISGSLGDPETTSVPLDEAIKGYGKLIVHPIKVSKHALGYLFSLVGIKGKDDIGTCQNLKAGATPSVR